MGAAILPEIESLLVAMLIFESLSCGIRSSALVYVNPITIIHFLY